MRDDDLLQTMIDRLTAATCFEDAAEVALRAVLGLAAGAIEAQRHLGRGRVLRALVHLRPDDAYRRLWVAEHEPSPSRTGLALAEGATLPSATAWRLVAERGLPVLIDVQLGTLRLSLPEGEGVLKDDGAPQPFEGNETRERLRGRNATHVHVIPLRTPGGGVVGMVSIEARCPPALAEALVQACNARLALLANVAAPYLVELPNGPASPPRVDDSLPVVGRSTASLVELLRVFAQQEETLLIAGPTGVGKSRFSRWCHERSRRRARPFETLDLLSVPEDLQMAELFGWRRGAFTGAVKDTPGAIARAEGGTLFIDEIDKLSPKAQAGLLRVLEERVYRPLGEAAGDRRADVRFVIGTNVNLLATVRAGRFREDLYYRINVLPVRVPTLAERRDEIPLWAAYMLARRHREGGGEGEAQFDAGALALLCESPWPGNLRQLDNIVRRVYAIALGERGTAGAALVLQKSHVDRALAYEGEPETISLVGQLKRAAHAFVREAERRRGEGALLPLELTDALRGLVLLAAAEQLGSREEAFLLFGQETLVKGRNHHKVLRREIEKVEELCRALGEDMDAALSEGGGAERASS